jgi:type III pantothenate kinase
VAGKAVADAIARSLAPFGPEPDWVVGSAAQCGVRSSNADPSQLGPDRWAALIGARHLHAGACVVVNAGTTMTVDALSADGVFVGGCIVAGKRLMHEALASNTARLALQDGRFSFFPDNTGDAIESGALNALAGAIERMQRYLSDAGEKAVTTLVSGGDAELLAPMLTAARLVDNLVLEGLLRIGESSV